MAKNTKEKILNIAIEMWLENPFSVNAYSIAKKAGFTRANIVYHLGKDIKKAITEYAIITENKAVIAQLTVLKYIS